LVRVGALSREHVETRKYLDAPIINWRGVTTGYVRAAPGLID